MMSSLFLMILASSCNNNDKGRVQKKSLENSTLGWVGVSGVGSITQKKQKENMPLKSILDHFKLF